MQFVKNTNTDSKYIWNTLQGKRYTSTWNIHISCERSIQFDAVIDFWFHVIFAKMKLCVEKW